MKSRYFRYLCAFSLLFLLMLALMPEDAFARRGGGSFGGARSSRSFNSSSRGSSFGGSRSSGAVSRSSNSSGSSFGGNRATQYSARQQYGIPRKVETHTTRDANGISRNYQVNDYGGYSSGLMRGYVAGSVSSYMNWLPWYGAFWYSRPTYVTNPDGTVGVYPPTFSYTKLIFFLLVIYFMYKIFFKRRRAVRSNQSFGQSDDIDYTNSGGKSSFD